MSPGSATNPPSSGSATGSTLAAFRKCEQRAESCGSLREWLHAGAIDKDPNLIADLTKPNTAMLCDDRDAIPVRKQGRHEPAWPRLPDNGDAQVLPLAYPVAMRWQPRRPGPLHQVDYDPFAHFRNGDSDGSLLRSDARWRNGAGCGY